MSRLLRSFSRAALRKLYLRVLRFNNLCYNLLHMPYQFFFSLIILGANIFVSSDGVLKLGDFGSSIKLKNPLQTIYGEISNIRGTVGK